MSKDKYRVGESRFTNLQNINDDCGKPSDSLILHPMSRGGTTTSNCVHVVYHVMARNQIPKSSWYRKQNL